MARYFVTAQLSDRLAETPEGFLLCRAVPIARTGTLDYLPDEVPLDVAGPEGKAEIIRVYRLADDLFAPAAMASFEGKPVTLTHPDDDVTPETWRQVACGHVQNVRRGSGAEADLLLADLLITDPAAIAAIRRGHLREVSCGYDAAYAAIAPGVGRQSHIRGNHVALVEAGRCGPRCTIRDEKTRDKDTAMKTAKRGLLGLILGTPALRKTIDADPTARAALDEAIAEEVKDEGPDPAPNSQPQTATDATNDSGPEDLGEIKVLLRSILEKLEGASVPAADATEELGSEEEPEEIITDAAAEQAEAARTGDRRATPAPAALARRTVDAALTRDAAILAPSLAVAAGDPATVVQRLALRQAMARDRAVTRTVDAVLGGQALETAPPSLLHAAFAASVAVARERANGRTADALVGPGSKGPGRTHPHDTPAGLNQLFAAHRQGHNSPHQKG